MLSSILAITQKTNKRIQKGKYEIICITNGELEKQLKENALPILPMLKEAKTIINSEILSKYKKTKLTNKNTKWHLETTKSAMKLIESSIELSKNLGKNENDSTAYSLILRLRTLYIMECIRKNKIWKKKDFLKV